MPWSCGPLVDAMVLQDLGYQLWRMGEKPLLQGLQGAGPWGTQLMLPPLTQVGLSHPGRPRAHGGYVYGRTKTPAPHKA